MSSDTTDKRRDPDQQLARLRLERRADGQLWLQRDGHAEGDEARDVAVRIAPCFPWSRTRQYISVRTTDDKEVALIGSLDELADDTRRLVEQALAEIGFVLEILDHQSRKLLWPFVG
jgi:hypothetical protein